MRRLFVAVLAVAAVVALPVVSAGATPEGFTPSKHVVTVTKTVEGLTADQTATFIVRVDCQGQTYDLTFDEDGGTQSVVVGNYFSGDQSCTVAELDSAGAQVDITYGAGSEGSQCFFNGHDGRRKIEESTEQVHPDQVCEADVLNEFTNPPETTTTEPVTTTVQVPVAVVGSPHFTG